MFIQPVLHMRMSSGKLQLDFPLSFAIDSEFAQRKMKNLLLLLVES